MTTGAGVSAGGTAAGTFATSATSAGAAGAAGEEGIKNTVANVFGNAGAGVGEIELGDGAGIAEGDIERDVNRASVRHGLHGVDDEVEEDLL